MAKFDDMPDEARDLLEQYLRDFMANAYKMARVLDCKGDTRDACMFYGKAIAGHQILEDVVGETDKAFEHIILSCINPYLRGEI